MCTHWFALRETSSIRLVPHGTQTVVALGHFYFQTGLVNAVESTHRQVPEFRDRDVHELTQVLIRMETLCQGFNQSLQLLNSNRNSIFQDYFIRTYVGNAYILVSAMFRIQTYSFFLTS